MEAKNNSLDLPGFAEGVPGHVYFIGIGGIGMSALARYFKFRGCRVSGYDKTDSVLTRELTGEGMEIHYTDDVNLLSRDVDLVVYTPAVPADHKELTYYRQHRYRVRKRSEVLGEITKSSFNICVAGTHGKTTITTMIAHILRHSGYGCNAFLGGISVNYGTNFWSSERNVCVVEADEYDRSFLKLSPDVAVITAMDADHLDIYGTEEALQEAFVEFAHKVKQGGLLVSRTGLKKEKQLQASQHLTYGLRDDHADARARNIAIEQGSYHFEVVVKDWSLDNVQLPVGGLYNVENAIAAISVAHHVGIGDEKIKMAVAAFQGVRRRFEYVMKTPEHVFIDDYAHHPEELRALIMGARDLYPAMRCTIVFQPHLYSRTKDLADGFARSLDLADEVILLPIYPARELPVPGVTSKMIADKMSSKHKKLMGKEELLEWIGKHKPAMLIMAGAGDIDVLVSAARERLQENY
jgi:UDP-N-acetylmuramate--alanine ligase